MAFSCLTGALKTPRKVNGYGADYAHIWVNNQFLENEKYEEYLDMLNEWEIDGYYECYNWLLHCTEKSQDKDRAIESANRVLTDFLSVWRRRAPQVYRDVMGLMAYCAHHQFINMTPTLKERIDADWKESGTDEDKEGLYNSLLPYPMELYKMFQEEKYEEAGALLVEALRGVFNTYVRGINLSKDEFALVAPYFLQKLENILRLPARPLHPHRLRPERLPRPLAKRLRLPLRQHELQLSATLHRHPPFFLDLSSSGRARVPARRGSRPSGLSGPSGPFQPHPL